MSDAAKKPNQINPESYSPKKPEILRMAEEIYKNNSIPQKLILEDVPKIGWGQINGRAPTDYSLPGCLGNIISYIDEIGNQKSTDISKANILLNVDKIGFGQHTAITIDNSTLDKANQTLMNVTGISYGTLWLDYDGQGFNTMINELARVNHFTDMIDRSMKYYGREYLYIEDDSHSTYYEEIKKAIIISINKGYPVLAENICGIPEFSIITGYDDYGNKLFGWAYCAECANEFLENGMFVGAIDKNIPNNNLRKNPWGYSKLLIIGDKKDVTLSDKDIIEYAIEVMERKTSQNTAYRTYTAGLTALEAFRDAMLDQGNGLVEKPEHGHFIHLMILNIAEPRAYIASFMNRLSKKYADNTKLSQTFTHLEDISVAIQKPCHEMWGVKGNKEITTNEKRKKFVELIQVCIDYDKNTLNLLKEVAELL